MKNLFALLLCILVTATTTSNVNAEFISVIDLGASFRLTAVNRNGVVVGQDIATGIASMWQNGIVTSLGTVGGTQSYANDINDSSVVVGTSGDKGFVYNSVTSQLQDTNAFARTGFSVDQINSLTGINDLGFYVGEATIGGVRHGIAGFITVPEPSSFALLASLGFLLLRHRQKDVR